MIGTMSRPLSRPSRRACVIGNTRSGPNVKVNSGMLLPSVTKPANVSSRRNGLASFSASHSARSARSVSASNACGGALLELVGVPHIRRDDVTSERVPDEDHRLLGASGRIDAVEHVADRRVHVVIHRVLAVLGLLVRGGVAQSFDQETAQPIVHDIRLRPHVLHEAALMAAHLVRPEHQFEAAHIAGARAAAPEAGPCASARHS